MGRQVSTNSPSMRRIVAVLEQGGKFDAESLAEAACVSLNTLQGGAYMRRLLTEGLAHISGWRRNLGGGNQSPLYSAGPGPRKSKPKPFTNAEKSKRWRQRTGYRSEAQAVAKRLHSLITHTRTQENQP